MKKLRLIVLVGLMGGCSSQEVATTEAGTLVAMIPVAASNDVPKTQIETSQGFYTVRWNASGKKGGRVFLQNGWVYVEQQDGKFEGWSQSR